MANIKDVGKYLGRGPIGAARGLGHAVRGMSRGAPNAARGPTTTAQVVGGLGKRLGGLGLAALAGTLGPLGEGAYQTLKSKRNRWLIICILIGLFFLIFTGVESFTGGQQGQGENPLQITKTGPSQAQKGDILQYVITVSYPGSAQDAVVNDPIPDGSTYFCSSVGTTPCKKGDNKGKLANNTVTWDAKDLKLPLNNPISLTFTLGLTATKNNNNVGNIASVSLVGGTLAEGGLPSTNYVPPTTNDCGGKYASQIASNYLLHENFGDPQCNFSKDQVYAELKQQDPKDADTFFTIIVPCESSWIPLTWAPPSTGTPNSQGAWGLFQMGDSRPPGGPVTGTINDRGDVNWPLQVTSATNKAKTLQSLNSAYGGYWSSLDWSRCG